jgi:hypothetical protein
VWRRVPVCWCRREQARGVLRGGPVPRLAVIHPKPAVGARGTDAQMLRVATRARGGRALEGWRLCSGRRVRTPEVK